MNGSHFSHSYRLRPWQYGVAGVVGVAGLTLVLGLAVVFALVVIGVTLVVGASWSLLSTLRRFLAHSPSASPRVLFPLVRCRDEDGLEARRIEVEVLDAVAARRE